MNPERPADYSLVTAAYTDNQTTVQQLVIFGEKIVPLSIFCLTKLDFLYIEQASFENGNISYS
jgi:hypothetical protein